MQGERAAALAAFWANELRHGAPPLDLATDRVRPPLKTENGRVHDLPLGEVLTEQVRATARTLRVTPYMLLLSVYQMFLFLQTGQRRLNIGAPTAGRGMPGSEGVMGHFVNTVVLACEIDPDASFTDLTAATRERMVRVLDHQDQPFPLLVEQLRPPRDPSRSPLFQVMYNWNQQRSGAMAKTGDSVALYGDLLKASSTGTRGATHDLTLNVQDYGNEYRTAWTFNTDLFDDATVAAWSRQFATLAGQCLASPQRPAGAFSLAADADKARVAGRAWRGLSRIGRCH
ncbi:Surfactin synthase subunit 1 [compost metagenome]